jgi:3-hydroxybutyrate dehydrogenase
MPAMERPLLSGQRALVTGSTSGIGLGVARALLEAGAEVWIHGLIGDDERAALLHELRLLGPVQFTGGDLADPAAIEAMVANCGDLDILVNNAGIQHTASLADMPPATWDRILAINLSAAFHTMRLVMPGMASRGHGRVVNIASVHGLVASVHKAPYVAAKHGLVGLTKVAALEYAASGSRQSGGVTANCICPGWVETPLIQPQVAARAAAHGGDTEAGVRALLAEKQPSLRMSLPADIGALAVFLCRPEAHNLTGAALPVDGGWTAQ